MKTKIKKGFITKSIPSLLVGLSLAITINIVAADNAVSISNGNNPKQTNPQPTPASSNAVAIENTKNIDKHNKVWTAERFKNAKPMPLPKTNSLQSGSNINSDETLPFSNEPSVTEQGHAPVIKIKPDLKNRLFIPNKIDSEKKSSNDLRMVDSLNSQNQPSDIVAMDVGTKGAYFSSSRLTPLSADQSYPYKTVGKLFFTKSGVDYLCSAAVIKPRLILTAGHCVHSGNSSVSGYYSDFVFIPAYRQGLKPYQAWSWQTVKTTDAWYSGRDSVPSTADYAFIELEDNNVAGTKQKIGNVVGWLGYKTNALRPNHAHLLGYPGNFDSGEIMHQVTAQSFAPTDKNNVFYGSDMGGGSSGGPWVMNFGLPATGQTSTGRNLIIGVTSWGYIGSSANFKVQASSTFDSRFTTLINQACGWRSGNC